MTQNYIYKLVDQRGIIETRKPFFVNGNITFCFTGAPVNAHVVFSREDGATIYRLLSNETCEMNADWLSGHINVIIAVLDGSMKRQRWICESFFAANQNNTIFIYPDDIDLQTKIAELYKINSDMQKRVQELSTKIAEIEGKITTLIEGYDIV